jgi:hypothetical protein
MRDASCRQPGRPGGCDEEDRRSEHVGGGIDGLDAEQEGARQPGRRRCYNAHHRPRTGGDHRLREYHAAQLRPGRAHGQADAELGTPEPYDVCEHSVHAQHGEEQGHTRGQYQQ